MAKYTPNFTLVPSEENSTLNNSSQDINLIEVLLSVLNKTPIRMQRKQLQNICMHDLHIDLKPFSEEVVNIIIEALLYYMTFWNGWSLIDVYQSEQFSIKECFESYRQYLSQKCNAFIANVSKCVNTSSHPLVTNSYSQTEHVKDVPKDIAPYKLVLEGPPHLLNNVIFLESKGNMILKQHIPMAWQSLELKEFINWPHVSVTVKLPDIHFSRTNVHPVQRYLSNSDNIPIPPDENRIVHISSTDESGSLDTEPYSHDFFIYYFLQFKQVIESISGISSSRARELEIIMNEFLKDIKEANVYNCTMATGASIGYNIGNFKYIRTKKTQNTSDTESDGKKRMVNYWEIFTPQMDFSLYDFKAEQDHSVEHGVSFCSLNEFKKKSSVEQLKEMSHAVNYFSVIYSCKFCDITFGGPSAYISITKHFSTDHQREHSLKCCKCQKEFEVKVLAGNRWSHKCVS